MDAISSLARVPRRPPRADVLLAGVLFLWAMLEALLGTGPGPTAGRIAFATVISVPLVVRRRAPFAVALVLSAATLLWALHAARPESGTMPFPCLLVAAFSVALYERRLILAITGGAVLLGTMLVALETKYTSPRPGPGNIAILCFFMSGAWGAGWLVRQRAAQARQAVAESGELARSAVAEERAMIARELHDVVAHSVSIIAVQAGAAEELIELDPGKAREHMASVRRTAREAMSEMRRLLDVLRTEEHRYAPQPGLARLPDLLDEATGAGVTVALDEEGERPRLSPGIDLVAFRVIQESLTNVRKHAPGAAADVRLRYLPESLEIEVANPAGANAADPNAAANGHPGGGHGLIGMRERVTLFGGTFEARPTDGGGFRVRANLPLEEELR